MMQRVSVAEFEIFADAPENSERRFELIDGFIEEKDCTEWRGVIIGNVLFRLGTFVRENHLGRLALRPYHRILADNYNALLPDIAFTRQEHALPVVREGAVPQMPDLVVEADTSKENFTKLRRKAAYYLENGAQMVWLVFPEKRIIEIYTADGNLQILTEADELSGGDLLPGFKISVADLFAE